MRGSVRGHLAGKKQKRIDICSHIFSLLTLYIDNLHRIYRNRQFQTVDDFSHVEARSSSHAPIVSRGMLICTDSFPPRPGSTPIRPPRSLTTLLELDLIRGISSRGCGGRTVGACFAGTAHVLRYYISDSRRRGFVLRKKEAGFCASVWLYCRKRKTKTGWLSFSCTFGGSR